VHPALSIIVFTTLSGMGYGLLAWLGVLAPLGFMSIDRLPGVAADVLALMFVTIGLLSSSLHLGHPERAWRALSQWRSSWLSREGIASLVTYVPAGLYGLLWFIGSDRTVWAAAGLASALGAVATVICTAMIYRSLKPIRRWNNGWVLPNYIALSAATGGAWLVAVLAATGELEPGIAVGAAVAFAISAALKLGYWRWIDQDRAGPTIASATGLGRFGTVRLLDPPHTEDNYLLKEMGFRIARRHAAKLRGIALVLGFAAPIVLLLATAATGGAIAAVLAVAAALAASAGVFVERWLFFAEAKHTVTLYYGAATASADAPAG
jgi:sulfite dehydrogenase (quinone) subunit SoeC